MGFMTHIKSPIPSKLLMTKSQQPEGFVYFEYDAKNVSYRGKV